MAGLPALVQVSLRAVRSSTCTVPRCAATVFPHRSSILIPSGLPFGTANFVPAEKYVTMSTCFSRSALSVNDDMPSSYFLAAMPGRMPSNALFWNSTSNPSFWPTALPRSTSMPMIVVPSVSTNSLGA